MLEIQNKLTALKILINVKKAEKTLKIEQRGRVEKMIKRITQKFKKGTSVETNPKDAFVNAVNENTVKVLENVEEGLRQKGILDKIVDESRTKIGVELDVELTQEEIVFLKIKGLEVVERTQVGFHAPNRKYFVSWDGE